LGRNTSLRSETTSIDASVAPAGREKKWSELETAMKATFVLLSAFGKESRDSRIVLAAVATIPDWTAAGLTSIKNA
jgi:hypothetical protein